MQYACFSFREPSCSRAEEGLYSVEEGIMALLQKMEAGKFHVFATLGDWWQEFRMYHRKDGKIVPFHDDLMSATRYAAMASRFAVSGKDPTWTGELKYQNYGIV